MAHSTSGGKDRKQLSMGDELTESMKRNGCPDFETLIFCCQYQTCDTHGSGQCPRKQIVLSFWWSGVVTRVGSPLPCNDPKTPTKCLFTMLHVEHKIPATTTAPGRQQRTDQRNRRKPWLALMSWGGSGYTLLGPKQYIYIYKWVCLKMRFPFWYKKIPLNLG